MQNETFLYVYTKPNSVSWNMEYFGLWNISEYGIFWNMENFGIWNFSIRIMAYSKTKQYFIIHKTYPSYFGICDISEYRIFKNMEYFGIRNIFQYGIWHILKQ